MEDRFSQQLKKGVLELVILDAICRRPDYGYGLMQRIKTRIPEFASLKEGTMYPVLYRLEDEGLIVSRWQTQDRNSPKKIYQATDAGKEEAHRRITLWGSFCRNVQAMLWEEETQ